MPCKAMALKLSKRGGTLLTKRSEVAANLDEEDLDLAVQHGIRWMPGSPDHPGRWELGCR